MKIFATKYALTEGILEFNIDGEPKNDIVQMSTQQWFYKEGKDWHRTKEEAIARAEQMRVAKIKSLRKSIDKLENMRFQ